MKNVFMLALIISNLKYHSLFSQTTSTTFDSTWAAQFQGAIDDVITAGGIHGTSVAIYYPGQGTFIGVGGESSPGIPITPDMQFGIGENTRLFTAVLALRLQELGFFSLDDSLSEYLSPLLQDYPNIDGSATIRQCLLQKGGFFDYSDDVEGRDSAVVYGPDTFFTTQMILDRVGPPHFAPGTSFRFSTFTDYFLILLVIENTTGQSYTETLHQYILDPLGLDSTFVAAYEAPNGTVAEGWYFDDNLGSIPSKALYSMYSGGGAIFTTASEMMQWYYHLYNGHVISDSSMSQLLDIEPASRFGMCVESAIYPPLPDEEIWSGNGYIPGYTSVIGWDLKQQSVTCVLVNQLNYEGEALNVLVPVIDHLYFDIPKKQLDAGIISIDHPEYRVCEETASSVVELYNYGSDPIHTVEIHYVLDQEPERLFHWSGTIGSNENYYVFLPDIPVGPGEHSIVVFTSFPNGLIDLDTGNDTSRLSFINVNGLQPVNKLFEDFEDKNFPPPGWNNGKNLKLNWGRSSLALLQGTGCAVKHNWDDATGRNYDLELPYMDLSGVTHPVLSYYWAFGYADGYNDELNIDISTDCGNSYKTIYHAAGEELQTAYSEEIFFPKDDEWLLNVIDLQDYREEVLIKFNAVTNRGNNLYIDLISVDESVGVEVHKNFINSLIVYPNPANNTMTLKWPIDEPSTIQILNHLGQPLSVENVIGHETNVNLEQFPPGIYLARRISRGHSDSKIFTIVR